MTWDSEVCVFAADTREALIAEVQRVLAAIRNVPSLTLADVAYTTNRRFADPMSQVSRCTASLMSA